MPPTEASTCPEQGRGDESETQAAHVGRGGESGNVGDDPAADGQDKGRAVDAEFDEAAIDGLDGLQGLDALARTDQHGVVFGQQRMVQAVDGGVGDDHDTPLSGEEFGEQLGSRTDIDLALLADVECGFHYLTFLGSKQM